MDNLTYTSWLHGKHSSDIEINTQLPYVAIYDYFAQGDDADQIINEINEIYNSADITVLDACKKWYLIYF